MRNLIFKPSFIWRPYDLRHAAVSTWLNAGVPVPQVAEWAGHSVDVLLRVYAKCISDQQPEAKRRIEEATRTRDDSMIKSSPPNFDTYLPQRAAQRHSWPHSSGHAKISAEPVNPAQRAFLQVVAGVGFEPT
jgi:hypothetical protein